MNNKGQFSIIAALFVSVILITTVIITYSTIRNNLVPYQPQFLSAIDETNLALRQILGFTVGYYGSVLQVTGNSTYAKMLATNYLYSGLVNIANMHPEWGTSFRINPSDLDMRTYWFTNSSYSMGNLLVKYNLTGLGMYGLTYKTSCRLAVNVENTLPTNQTQIVVTRDEGEPLINLGKQNFKFYRYMYSNSTWELISPSVEPLAFANGTYLIDIPSGVDPYSYVIQVEDPRGIIVVASSFSRYTSSLTWDDIFETLPEGTSVDILTRKGTFTKATTTGPQTITGVGFTPKAVIFWWTRQTSYGESAAVRVGYGFATNYGGSYQNRGVAFASDDALGSSDTGRRRSETYSIIILNDGAPVLGSQASVTAFTSDGFTLNWQTSEARADIIHYVALGGADLTQARADSFSLTASSGTQDVTSVGFRPDFAMFLWTFTEAVNTNTANAEIGLGFAVSSTKRCAIVANSEDNRGTMDTWQRQRTDSCILLLSPTTGGQDAIVDFNQFLSNGFRLNKSDAPAAATPIFYLALQGGSYDVGSFTSPTSTGSQNITGIGFQPKLVMLATQGRVAATTIGSHAELALGAATSATNRGVTWFEDPDNLADSDNEMETLNTKIIQWRDRTALNTFTLRGSADFISFLSDGFRLSWSNVETTGKQIIYVTLGAQNYSSAQNPLVVELLQNGTMRWLGENLQLTTQAKPIPPIPVKSIHVNQTINSVNQEVSFQIEDWASDYEVPLGLTNNASVFNSRTMIVFIVNSSVSKVTIWWDGRDTATQTSYAYINRYFTVNPSQRTLTNGVLDLQIDFSEVGGVTSFKVISTVGTATSTAEFMRINNEVADYGDSEPTYAIINGVVRVVVQHEVEWESGAPNCPNVYAQIVLTLPANATYYTYQLRFMFVESQQDRTITDLCPIKLTTSIGLPKTENGTASGYPIVSNTPGLFYNFSSSIWAHHWSQFISGTKGTGIMYTDSADKRLYIFDTIAGSKTGALKISNATGRSIELLPVTMAQAKFKYALDVTWNGAVVTFDATTPIYKEEGGNKTGLWIIVEYPPTITVQTEN